MRIANAINFMIPKRNIWIFNSFPDVNGNALELYKYICMYRKDLFEKYKFIWCVDSPDVNKIKTFLSNVTGIEKHNVIRKRSFRGIITYFLSRLIISTHGYFPQVKTAKKQKHINLWHGMPMKKIGYMLRGKNYNGINDNADYTIATSIEFQKIMANAFNLGINNVLLTGQPRNDSLFHTKNAFKKIGVNKENYKKVILWMPTYRKSVVGDVREDGKLDAFGVLDIVNNHFCEFNQILLNNQFLLIIKPHPMDAICKIKLPSSSNIKVIMNTDLDKHNVLLYELLGETDVLFTDYSSVFIDYLILDRPIAFLCNDVSEYSENRGFNFEPVCNFLPGQLIQNYSNLVNYIAHIDEINEMWKEKRKELNGLFNSYSDDKNSERVLKFITELDK